MTIKRTPLGELFMAVVVDEVDELATKSETGKSAGFDFGLKTFLTCSDGSKIESPQFFKQSLNAVRKANRQLSSKVRILINLNCVTTNILIAAAYGSEI